MFAPYILQLSVEQKQKKAGASPLNQQ